MAHFQVDLKTKMVAADTRVFLARSGKGGHLFQQVLENRAIGPDLPDLDLDLSNGLAGDKDLEAKVKRARALSSWLRRPTNLRGNPPSRNLADFRNAAKRSGHAQIEGIVKSYFSDLRAGDLLIVPHPSYFGEAIIAEVLALGAFPARIPGVGRYDGVTFSGRQFGHFVTVKMSALPRQVIDLAKAPTGFAEISDDRVRRRIFELGYPDYVLDDNVTSKIFTTKADFTPFDGNVLNALVTMVATNVERLQHGEGHPALVNLVDAAFLRTDDEDLQVKIDINSPGHLAIIDRSVVPLVVAAVLAVLTVVGFDAAAFGQDTEVVVTNSRVEAVLDVCSEEVGQLTQSMLRFLAAEAGFQQTCTLLKQAHENTGAHPSASATVEQ